MKENHKKIYLVKSFFYEVSKKTFREDSDYKV